MNEHQQLAIERHCRFAFETAHPRFARLDLTTGVSIVLTVNSGWESLEMGYGGPVWHASVMGRGQTKIKKLRQRARQELAGVGDLTQEWEDWTGTAFHVRRRLTEAEAATIGPALDLRHTTEAKQRVLAMGSAIARIPPQLLRNEV